VTAHCVNERRSLDPMPLAQQQLVLLLLLLLLLLLPLLLSQT
jgi:hypothetical protein